MKDKIAYTLFVSSQTATQIALLLPKTDLCEDLKDILLQQFSIISGFVEENDFNDCELEDFIVQCEKVSNQVEILNAYQK